MLNILQGEEKLAVPTVARSVPLNPDAVFGAVADGIRREILKQLRTGENRAGQIAAWFDVSWPAVSRHLRVLKKAGLVHERKQGRERYYSLDRERIRDVFGSWVAAFDLMWKESLESLKQQVESESQTRGEK